MRPLRRGRGVALGVLLGVALSSCAPAVPRISGSAWDIEIASRSEPGERLALSGVIRDAHGHPLPGAGVHVYHSDAHGDYAAAGSDGRPRLRGDLTAGPSGEYRIRSIVPHSAARGEPSHLHFEIVPRRGPHQSLVLYFTLATPGSGPTGAGAGPLAGPERWRPDAALRQRAPAAATTAPSSFAGMPIAHRDSTGVWQLRADLRLH